MARKAHIVVCIKVIVAFKVTVACDTGNSNPVDDLFNMILVSKLDTIEVGIL